MYLDVPFCMGIYAPFAGVKKGSVNLSIAAGGEHKPPAYVIPPLRGLLSTPKVRRTDISQAGL